MQMNKKKKKRKQVHNPITYNFTKKYIYFYYGFCLDTAEPIGLKRLMARPVAKYTIAAQEKHEMNEKVHADD